jgi:hypothetical protein
MPITAVASAPHAPPSPPRPAFPLAIRSPLPRYLASTLATSGPSLLGLKWPITATAPAPRYASFYSSLTQLLTCLIQAQCYPRISYPPTSCGGIHIFNASPLLATHPRCGDFFALPRKPVLSVQVFVLPQRCQLTLPQTHTRPLLSDAHLRYHQRRGRARPVRCPLGDVLVKLFRGGCGEQRQIGAWRIGRSGVPGFGDPARLCTCHFLYRR